MSTLLKSGVILFSLILILGFGNKHFEQNKQAIKEFATPPKIGEIAPDINLLSADRTKSYKLSDLRGKLVLVNFWASLVAPCRFENPNIVKAYNQFKDKNFVSAKGFTIYSVSLDSNLDNWKKAIKNDKLNWPYQVSDLKGYDSEVAAAYGIRSIPYNYLIDGDGKVLAINLRGAQLNKTIEKYLK
ncbi:MAG: TlpA family protein disulfide reductase [Bacteroidetes bacterium]|nr:MAG: TlpA family protein disulfide reductase [Bacteroidota bacterium]